MLKLRILFFIIISITIFNCFSENKTIKIDEMGVMFEDHVQICSQFYLARPSGTHCFKPRLLTSFSVLQSTID